MHMFQYADFWRTMDVSKSKLNDRFKCFFGDTKKTITNRGDALKILNNVISTIQEKLLARIVSESTYGMLLKLYYIFDEVNSIYLVEKEMRLQMVEHNIDDLYMIETFGINRNIERDIIDASNVWIENCVLYQHNLNINSVEVRKEFIFDEDLIIDLYLYGFASRGVSLLMLSTQIGGRNTFYGLETKINESSPAEILKYHPYIYFNTAIVGNQNILVDVPLTQEANNTEFGKGFKQEHNVDFLLFLAAIKSFHEDQLNDDEKALTVISKERFMELVSQYTNPPINSDYFYNAFVLTKDKIAGHLRNGEKIIWKVGTNKYRHEIRPFIGLDDGNIILAYGALEQAKQLWVSYSSNGGMCYTEPAQPDYLTKGMELRNKELSDILLEKIRTVLNKHYTAKIDLKDVKYQRIFGKHSVDYGDYDIVYYSEESKELFLIESKFFSDSLNSSGMITDYKKIFEKNGYYEHCRKRCDLALSESEKLKKFIGTNDKIAVHLLFISSKPIEMELTDEDGIVTMIPLSIFEKYIVGELISGEDGSIMRPVKYI